MLYYICVVIFMSMDSYIDEVASENFYKYLMVKVNDDLYLSENDIELLELYKIPYRDCKSLNEIIYFINNMEDFDDELEDLCSKLGERNYYLNTNK